MLRKLFATSTLLIFSPESPQQVKGKPHHIIYNLEFSCPYKNSRRLTWATHRFRNGYTSTIRCYTKLYSPRRLVPLHLPGIPPCRWSSLHFLRFARTTTYGHCRLRLQCQWRRTLSGDSVGFRSTFNEVLLVDPRRIHGSPIHLNLYHIWIWVLQLCWLTYRRTKKRYSNISYRNRPNWFSWDRKLLTNCSPRKPRTWNYFHSPKKPHNGWSVVDNSPQVEPKGWSANFNVRSKQRYSIELSKSRQVYCDEWLHNTVRQTIRLSYYHECPFTRCTCWSGVEIQVWSSYQPNFG